MSSMAIPTVAPPRKATATDVSHVSKTLALAFFDDPVIGWIIGDASERRRLLPGFFTAIASSYLAYDETYVSGDQAAAVWAPPGAEDDEELPESLGAAAGAYSERLFEILRLLDEHHPAEPHNYLFLLGTRPERQGHGLGSSLMIPVLDASDRERVPAYLEATSERNRGLYRRHGFEVVGEIALPDGPNLWPMWREPARS